MRVIVLGSFNGKLPVPTLTQQFSLSQNNDKKQAEGRKKMYLSVN